VTADLIIAAVATTSASRPGPLGGHLWHAIEALGFLVTSLGGIATAELIEARRRRRTVPVGAAAQPVSPSSASSVALLERPVRLAAPDHLPSTREQQFWLPLVAIAGAAAAAIHFVVMPDHFEESVLYGTFFAVAATAQIVYSLMVLARPSRALLAAGMLGNVAIVALWLVTRTAGIPLGPAAGSVEPVGGLDVLAGGFEIVTALGAIALLWPRRTLSRALHPGSWSRPVAALVPCAAVAIALTTYLSPPS
jgi:hypothetical protein